MTFEQIGILAILAGVFVFFVRGRPRYDGLDAGDIDNYYARVDAVSMEEVRRVVGAYFPLDDLVFVLVGKGSEIESVAAKYGTTLDTKSISDPGF